MEKTNFTRSLDRIIFITLIILLVIIYIYGHNAYVVEHIDNPWILSIYKSWWATSERADVVFGDYRGKGGSTSFGFIRLLIYGGILEIIGWTRSHAALISTIFIFASAYLWIRILDSLNFEKALVKWFPLALLFLEGSFAAANMARSEAIVFFFATSALYLIIHQYYFLAGLLFVIACESHPYGGALCGAYILSYAIYLLPEIQKDFLKHLKLAGIFTLGVFVGLLCYLALHYKELQDLLLIGQDSVKKGRGNTFIVLFTTGKYYWRHLPEIVIWVIAFIAFIATGCWKKERFILPFVLTTTLITLIIPNGGVHYFIYHYPAMLLVILYMANQYRIFPPVMSGLIILMLPQYFFIFWIQLGYDHEAYLDQLRSAVPQETKVIYGHPSAWYAFYDKEFHGNGYFPRENITVENWPDAFVLIENNHFIQLKGWNDLEGWEQQFNRTKITSFDYFDNTPVNIYSFTRKFN